MGGGTFAQASAPGAPTLHTPRMTPGEYARIKDRWLAKLRAHFGTDVTIDCGIEAPEKTDYGDVDIFAGLPAGSVDFVSMAQAVGATGVIVQSKLTCSLAVPRDESDDMKNQGEGSATIVYKAVQHRADVSEDVAHEKHAQIDFGLIEPALLPWWSFHSSYGDMIALVGRIVSSFGFRITNEGFWLRLEELGRAKAMSISAVPDKEGHLFLSRDPEQLMMFLVLSSKAYNEGFSTLADLFEWLGSCRFLIPEAFINKVEPKTPDELRRLQTRKMYAKFFSEWLPERMVIHQDEDGKERTLKLRKLREIHAREAVAFFDKGQEHEAKRTALLVAIGNAQAGVLIKELLAQHSQRSGRSLNEVAKAFRRWVGCGRGGSPHILSDPHTDIDSELHCFLADDALTLRDAEGLSQWTKDNWKIVRDAERGHGSRSNTSVQTST